MTPITMIFSFNMIIMNHSYGRFDGSEWLMMVHKVSSWGSYIHKMDIPIFHHFPMVFLYDLGANPKSHIVP